MEVICPKCSHAQEFSVEVKNYKGYVCPSCYAYFKTDGNLLDFKFIQHLRKLSPNVVTSLNESIKEGRKKFSIITIIEREDSYDYSNFEYVGLSHIGKDVYFGHGNDYYCVLKSVDNNKIKTLKHDSIQFSNFKHTLGFDENLRVKAASGFVFEDLTKPTRNKTFIHNHNENKFISEEEIDGEKEYYSGSYLSFDYFKNYFQLLRNRTIIEENTKLIFYKIIGFSAIILALIFCLLNFNNLVKQKISFYETFESNKTTNQFVGKSFELKGTQKMLVFDGISETNISGLNLWVKLVNEKTNEVSESKLLVHYLNDINYASGITVEFCKIPAGSYHMVFETSSNLDEPIDYKIDYRLNHGNIKYYPLIIGLSILFLIALVSYNDFFSGNKGNEFYKELLSVNYKIVLKQLNLGYVLAATIILFTAYTTYQNYIKTCATSTSLNTLEDHTYTGSRSHYYRSYSSDGSGHK